MPADGDEVVVAEEEDEENYGQCTAKKTLR